MDAFVSLPDGRRLPVRDGMTIGRGAQCDIVLDDWTVSRQHVRIVADGRGGFVAEDLGSENGIAVGGGRVKRHELRDGDEFAIGKTAIRFAVRALPAAAAPRAVPPPVPSPLREPVEFADEVDADEADEADAAPAQREPAAARGRRTSRRRGVSPLLLIATWLVSFVIFAGLTIVVLIIAKQKWPEADIYRLLDWLRENYPERFPRPK